MPETADQNVLATHQPPALAVVRTIALTARFDHAADVTLDELRAELIYLLDEQADRYFRGRGSADAGR